MFWNLSAPYYIAQNTLCKQMEGLRNSTVMLFENCMTLFLSMKYKRRNFEDCPWCSFPYNGTERGQKVEKSHMRGLSDVWGTDVFFHTTEKSKVS